MIDESLGAAATDLFQYVVLRRDLQEVDRWPFGAIVAQGVLAATSAIVDGLVASDKNTLEYTGTLDQTLLALNSMRTVVFEMRNGDKLRDFARQLGEQASLGVHLWQEPAVGNKDDLKYTALATWVAPKYMLDPLFKGLPTANWHEPHSRQITLFPVNGDPDKYQKCIREGGGEILNQQPESKRIKLWGEGRKGGGGDDDDPAMVGDAATDRAEAERSGIRLFGESDVNGIDAAGVDPEPPLPPQPQSPLSSPPHAMGSAIDFLRGRRSGGGGAVAGGGPTARGEPEITNMAELLSEVKGVTDKARADQDEIDKRLEELMADIDREDEMKEARAREEIEMQRLREAHADSLRKKAIERKAAEDKAAEETEMRRVEKSFLEEQARKAAEKKTTNTDRALPGSGDIRKAAGGGHGTDANSFWNPQLEHPWRRALGQRRLRASTDAMQEAWLKAWAERFDCWWLSLAAPSQTQLGACLGALALHISSRLDASWRATRSLMGHIPSPLKVSDSSPGAVDSNCQWLEQSELGLPDFPAFPFADDGGSFPWQLPPLPQLVPSWERLQALVAADEFHAAFTEGNVAKDVAAKHSSAKSAVITPAALAPLAGAGLTVGIIFTIGLFVANRRQYRSSRIAATRVAPMNARLPADSGRMVSYCH